MMELQIATDSAFTALIYNPGPFAVTSDTIAIVLGPTAATVVDFNPGSTYYWRVRTGVAGPMYSPWSKTNSFTVEGPVAFAVIAPVTGAEGVSMTPALVWNKFEAAIGYEVMVSMDPTFAILEFGHSTTQTFYKVAPEEALKYDTTYYWRARGVTGAATGTNPAPGGPWQVGIFTTEAKPAEPTPAVIVTPAEKEIQVIQVPVEKLVEQAIPSYLLWAIIVVGAVLVIALIVLIVRTRRVA